MPHFAAVEIKPGESEHQGIAAFFGHAASLGLSFKFLEPYGPLTIGSIKLLRFKTDCPKMETLLPFAQEDSRTLVLPGSDGYVIHTPTTKGKVPITTMQADRLPAYKRRYRGTSDKFWKRQFT